MATGDEALTLGVEEEFHLVDPASRRLVPRARDLLAVLPSATYAAELQRSVVETNTDVVTDLGALRRAVEELRLRLVSAAGGLGIGVASAGTVPLAVPRELEVTETPRYRRMLANYQLLAREQLIRALQVHVGVPDRDLAVAVAQRVSGYLPILLALSASSPGPTATTPATRARGRWSGSAGPRPAACRRSPPPRSTTSSSPGSSAPASSPTRGWSTSTSAHRRTCRRWSCGSATPARPSTTSC